MGGVAAWRRTLDAAISMIAKIVFKEGIVIPQSSRTSFARIAVPQVRRQVHLPGIAVLSLDSSHQRTGIGL